jgi:diguanylate cyclase (GGDEF)-like protein
MPLPPKSILPPQKSDVRDEDAGEKTRKVLLQRVGPNGKVVVNTLRVVAGRDMLRFVTMEEDEPVIIGRDETSSLSLSDASVSRRHARVRLIDSQVVVEDLGSTNGTAVNGQIIDRTNLNVGDHLEIGAVSLRLDMLSLEEVGHLESVLARLEAPRRDPLTGLLTRAYVDEELPELVARCERSAVDLSCVFLDIDHFKHVNDRFGHQVGDDALVAVARLLMVSLRDTDPCVRYGGEEFVMFLAGSSESGGADVAERIRKAVYGHDWSRTSAGLRVSVSLGVAQRRLGEPVKDWIARADKALYAAKTSGRNKVKKASELK